MFSLHHICNTALARLAIYANHSLVGATNMFWIYRQVRHGPFVVILWQRVKAFFDCVLMTARKRSVDKVSGIWLTLWHRQSIAIFCVTTQRINICDVKLWIDTVGK